MAGNDMFKTAHCDAAVFVGHCLDPKVRWLSLKAERKEHIEP